MHTRSRTRRWAAGLAAVALAVGACGSDDDGDGDSADASTTTAEAVDETTTAADSSDTTTTDDGIDLSGALFVAPPTEGAELVIEDTGIVSGTTTMTVTSVEESDAGVTVATSEVVASEGTEPVTVNRTYTTAPDGSLSISADAFVAQGQGFEVTATGDDVRIPSIAELAEGGGSSGNTFVELAAEGIDARTDVTYTVTGGGTESTGGGTESVTTPLGTFDVQVVSIELTVSSSLSGDQTGTIRFSFLPGFGVVKTDTSIAGFEIVSTVVSSTVEP